MPEMVPLFCVFVWASLTLDLLFIYDTFLLSLQALVKCSLTSQPFPNPLQQNQELIC